MTRKILLFTSDKIGEGELGQKVEAGFIGALLKMPADLLPSKIIFLNRGVLLSTQNSLIDNAETIRALEELEKLGVEVLSCQTCLEHFKVLDKVLVGKVSNALEILPDLLGSAGVISF
ncbi:hypothetical protein [Helicobacter bizzozeronii]|uniref:hypothetical protein n=1 Tax=Helicobacter bizzozeronii TaxID=56877 RepID=UPI000CEE4303|nr:hypothetical protein [Helicobacter bizzozeronii]